MKNEKQKYMKHEKKNKKRPTHVQAHVDPRSNPIDSETHILHF